MVKHFHSKSKPALRRDMLTCVIVAEQRQRVDSRLMARETDVADSGACASPAASLPTDFDGAEPTCGVTLLRRRNSSPVKPHVFSGNGSIDFRIKRSASKPKHRRALSFTCHQNAQSFSLAQARTREQLQCNSRHSLRMCKTYLLVSMLKKVRQSLYNSWQSAVSWFKPSTQSNHHCHAAVQRVTMQRSAMYRDKVENAHEATSITHCIAVTRTDELQHLKTETLGSSNSHFIPLHAA